MKKYYSFLLAAFFTISLCYSYAQENNALPNYGLTHKMTKDEKKYMEFMNKSTFSTNPPVGPVRNIAEFEPSEAVIIAYANGFGLPFSIIKDLSNTGKVIIIAKTSNQAAITTSLTSNGVNTANCSFLTVSGVNSWWTRDYTGWFIADSSHHVQVVDFPYNRPRPYDDAVTALEANQLGITMFGMDLIHTGGNYMCDGYNNAMSTTLVVTENTSMSVTQIQQMTFDYLGINNYFLRPDAQGQYIEHIDCWAKLLAPDKILVDSVPASDPQYSQYEAAAAFFASTDCPFGYKYKVIRVLIAGSAETATAEPYSNSFIFNNLVLVPIKGGASAAHDTAALRAYRKAMPGYIVKGYTSSGGAVWYGTDALHCRTHEIADRQMLYIEHFPLYGHMYSATGYNINAKVVSYAGNAIAANYPTIIYKVGNNGPWDSIPMTYVSYLSYNGNIPVQNAGDTVYYYLKAKDVTGKLAYHALMGKADPYFFIVDGNVKTPIISINSGATFSTYPNPSKGNFFLFLNSNDTDNAFVKISDITGKIIYQDNFIIETGANQKIINLDNVSEGIYIINIETVSERLFKKITIIK